MDAQITLETQQPDEVANQIRDRLLGFNQERVGPFQDVRVVLTARDAAGALLGGLVGLGDQHVPPPPQRARRAARLRRVLSEDPAAGGCP